MQDTDLDAFLAAYALNRRRTGIARGRPENMDNLAPYLGNVGIQLTHKLQCHILKCERRSMEQLKHIQRIIQFMKRRHIRRTEIAIAGVHHFFEITVRNFVVSIVGENLQKQLLEAELPPFLQRVRGNYRDLHRNH
ncbi:hypothetical protein D3C80_1646980 [compost metagenome]